METASGSASPYASNRAGLDPMHEDEVVTSSPGSKDDTNAPRRLSSIDQHTITRRTSMSSLQRQSSKLGDGSTGFNPQAIETMLSHINDVLAEHESMIQHPQFTLELKAAQDKITALEARIVELEHRPNGGGDDGGDRAASSPTPSSFRNHQRTAGVSIGEDDEEVAAAAQAHAAKRKQISGHLHSIATKAHNRDSVKMAADSERLHRVEHNLHQLTVTLNRLQTMSSSTPTRSDLNNVRSEAREVFTKIQQLVDDRSIESQELLDKTLQDDLAKLKSWMDDHDRMLSSRAQNFVEALADLKANDLEELRMQNDDLVNLNAALEKRVGLFQNHVNFVNNVLVRDKGLHNFVLMKKIVARYYNQQMYMGWRKWSEAAKAIAEEEAWKAKTHSAIKTVVRQTYTRKVLETFTQWRGFTGAVRALAEKQAEATKTIVTLVVKSVQFAHSAAFRTWKAFYLKHHRVRDHAAFRQLVMEEHDSDTRIQLIVDEIQYLKTEEVGKYDGQITALQDEARAATETSTRTCMEVLNAESKRLDTTIARLAEDTLPTLQARVGATEQEVAKIDGMRDELEGRLDAVEVLSKETEEAQKEPFSRIGALEAEVLEAQSSIAKLEFDSKTCFDKIKTTDEQALAARAQISQTQKNQRETNGRLERETSRINHEIHILAVKDTHLQEALSGHTTDIREAEFKLQQVAREATLVVLRKPEPRVIVEQCAVYEDLCCMQKFCPPFPETVAPVASNWVTSAAHYIAETANNEALERVFAGANPEELAYVEDELEARRVELREQMRVEVLREAAKVRPSTGALRVEARGKFCVRLMEAVDVALTKYETVVTLTNTRFGRVKAVPTCVACDRPLPTRQRKTAADTAPAERPDPAPASPTRKPGSNKTAADVRATTLPTPQYLPEEAPGETPGAGADGLLDTANANGPFVLRGGFRMPKKEKQKFLRGLTPMQKSLLAKDDPPILDEPAPSDAARSQPVRAVPNAWDQTLNQSGGERGGGGGGGGGRGGTPHRGKMRPRPKSASAARRK